MTQSVTAIRFSERSFKWVLGPSQKNGKKAINSLPTYIKMEFIPAKSFGVGEGRGREGSDRGRVESVVHV